jgi:uncharacterized protein
LIPIAFIKYLYHFHVDRDYFECHEILEEFWKEETDQQKNSIWVGFILLAVANYHHRRNNFTGAIRTLEKAIAILNSHKGKIGKLGITETELLFILKNHLVMLKGNNPYQSYSLPITDNALINQCLSINENAKQNWGNKSNLSDESLIHRHKLRDRSDVIKERQNAILHKQEKDRE